MAHRLGTPVSRPARAALRAAHVVTPTVLKALGAPSATETTYRRSAWRAHRLGTPTSGRHRAEPRNPHRWRPGTVPDPLRECPDDPPSPAHRYRPREPRLRRRAAPAGGARTRRAAHRPGARLPARLPEAPRQRVLAARGPQLEPRGARLPVPPHHRRGARTHRHRDRRHRRCGGPREGVRPHLRGPHLPRRRRLRGVRVPGRRLRLHRGADPAARVELELARPATRAGQSPCSP